MSILGLELGYTVKYGLSPRDFPQAQSISTVYPTSRPKIKVSRSQTFSTNFPPNGPKPAGPLVGPEGYSLPQEPEKAHKEG